MQSQRIFLVSILALAGCGAPKVDWPAYGEKAGIKVHFPGTPSEREDTASHEKHLSCMLVRESGSWGPLTSTSKPASLDDVCFMEASVAQYQPPLGVSMDFQVRRGYPDDAGSPKPVKDKLGREWQEYYWFWQEAMAKNPRSTLMERDRYRIDGNRVYKLNIKGALGPAETSYFYDSFEVVK